MKIEHLIINFHSIRELEGRKMVKFQLKNNENNEIDPRNNENVTFSQHTLLFTVQNDLYVLTSWLRWKGIIFQLITTAIGSLRRGNW